ncbi:hypothetical protein Tco_0678073 [Tanacetum coccineum]|uniref:FCP1 homology domain-containing protein n=1 Tax=Tanacetum coccineum TaxID=301880 RepID=A0ABQ4XE74_9ASTR
MQVLEKEDANLKLLRKLHHLALENNIALIMRNKSDLDTLSMDDLYNNLKVYESEIKGKSSSSSNSQNAKEGIQQFLAIHGTHSSQGSSSSGLLRFKMGLESVEARIVVHEKNEGLNDRFKTQGEGFPRSSPLPYTGNYMPSRPDIILLLDLDDSVYKTNYLGDDEGNGEGRKMLLSPQHAGWDWRSTGNVIGPYLQILKLLDESQSLEEAIADYAGKKTNEKLANEGERNSQEKEAGASNKEVLLGKVLDNADDLPTDTLMP